MHWDSIKLNYSKESALATRIGQVAGSGRVGPSRAG